MEDKLENYTVYCRWCSKKYVWDKMSKHREFCTALCSQAFHAAYNAWKKKRS